MKVKRLEPRRVWLAGTKTEKKPNCEPEAPERPREVRLEEGTREECSGDFKKQVERMWEDRCPGAVLGWLVEGVVGLWVESLGASGRPPVPTHHGPADTPFLVPQANATSFIHMPQVQCPEERGSGRVVSCLSPSPHPG